MVMISSYCCSLQYVCCFPFINQPFSLFQFVRISTLFPLPPSLFPAVFLILYRLLCPATSILTTTTTSSDHDYDRRRPRLRPAATTTAVLSGSPCLQRSTKVSEFYWQAQSSALQNGGPRHSDGNIKVERRRRDRIWLIPASVFFL